MSRRCGLLGHLLCSGVGEFGQHNVGGIGIDTFFVVVWLDSDKHKVGSTDTWLVTSNSAHKGPRHIRIISENL
jgi:hypothetical protein